MSNYRFKFRVYLPDENRYMHTTDCPVIDSSGELMWCYLNPFGHWEHYPMENAVVEQCTGLKDKNGRLIYEGDVVRYYRSTAMGLGGERIASVLWRERDAEFYILTTLGDGYNMREALRFGIEIIGNIHEMELEQ